MDAKIAKLDADFREIENKLSSAGLSAAEVKELSLKHAAQAPVIGADGLRLQLVAEWTAQVVLLERA